MNHIELSSLPKLVQRSKKRVGRGHGSGKVKTSGRGTKGQKARGSVHPGFEGGQLSLIKRMPYLRGRGKNTSMHAKPLAVNIYALAKLSAGTTVTVATLIEQHIVKKGTQSVKIVGKGILPHKLTVQVPVTQSVQQAVEKAGGSVQVS